MTASATIFVGGGGVCQSKSQRLILGFIVLIAVDLIWVVSSEFTRYFCEGKYYSSKPYFNTFIKTSMLAVYLGGFLLHRSWWYQCNRDNAYTNKDDDVKIDADKFLGDPIFVPMKCESKRQLGVGSESDESSAAHAEDALLARMSYAAFSRIEEARQRAANKLTVRQIVKIAVIFTFILFVGNLSYQEALRYVDSGIINILFSTSALFTLFLASVFPASSSDRFTLSKLVAVSLSIGGIVLMSWSSKESLRIDQPFGIIWPVLCALFLALFIVLLRRCVDNEDKLNMPMFYGFLGFFTLVFLWPGLVILHFTSAEILEWPDTVQWILLVVNGIVGVVISNVLWLWGCFLTSSLAATLSLTLIMPMSALAGVFFSKVDYNWMFYLGVGPVFFSFFAVGLLSHYDNSDPVLLVIKKALQCICRRRLFTRTIIRGDGDREQTESLIGVNSDRSDS